MLDAFFNVAIKISHNQTNNLMYWTKSIEMHFPSILERILKNIKNTWRNHNIYFLFIWVNYYIWYSQAQCNIHGEEGRISAGIHIFAVHVCVCMHLSFFLSFLSSSLSFFFSLSFTHLPTYLTVIYLSIHPTHPSIHPFFYIDV